jgi:hypothetical protein
MALPSASKSGPPQSPGPTNVSCGMASGNGQRRSLNGPPPQWSRGDIRIELSDVKVDGDIVTYTQATYLNNELVSTDYDYQTVVKDGKIIFDGPEMFRQAYCRRDPSLAFCPAG